MKLRDEDHKIKGFVRAHNMDHQGNNRFNPVNGFQRGGINSIVPENLQSKYEQKVMDFEDNRRIKLPQTSEQTRKNIFWYH